MTLPDERYRAVRIARELMYALLNPKQTPKVPKEVRRRASRCLRHYPSGYEMERTAAASPGVWEAND